MATINTADDFIDVLRSDDRVRSAVRREILSDELIALPDKVDKMVEAQTEMLKTQTTILENIGEIREEQVAQREEQKAQREEQVAQREEQKAQREEQVAQREEQVAQREEQVAQREEQKAQREADRSESIQDMHRFRGNYAVDAAAKRWKEIAKHFSTPKNMGQVKCVALSPDDVEALIDEAPQALAKARFSDDEIDYTPAADLVLGVMRRREAEPEFYVVVEASYTADNGDVGRAIVRAKVVGVATGLDTYAVVASVHVKPTAVDRITRDAGKGLASAGANSAFWYQIVETDMEPPSPR